MQFAAGRTIAWLAEEWGWDAERVEEAVRAALLERIPVRDGGLKPARAHISVERGAARKAQRAEQTRLEL
jgi:hypothetical protein